MSLHRIALVGRDLNYHLVPTPPSREVMTHTKSGCPVPHLPCPCFHLNSEHLTKSLQLVIKGFGCLKTLLELFSFFQLILNSLHVTQLGCTFSTLIFNLFSHIIAYMTILQVHRSNLQS